MGYPSIQVCDWLVDACPSLAQSCGSIHVRASVYCAIWRPSFGHQVFVSERRRHLPTFARISPAFADDLSAQRLMFDELATACDLEPKPHQGKISWNLSRPTIAVQGLAENPHKRLLI